jgi:transcriptional regulator with XRE-family HTH domain
MPEHFGVRLKRIRQHHGLTMEQLGCLVGVAKTTISGYENSNREPPLSIIHKLATSLQTSADYLLGLTEIHKQPLLQPSPENLMQDNRIHWDGIELEENELQSIKELMESIILERVQRKSKAET